MTEIINFIQRAMKEQFTGYIQINFFKGAFGPVVKNERFENVAQLTK